MKASTFLKQMLATIVAVVKAKSTAVRAKKSTLKTRLLVLGTIRNKKLLVSAINHKIHAIMGQQQDSSVVDAHGHEQGGVDDDDGGKKAVVLYTAPSSSYLSTEQQDDDAEAEEEEDSDDYLTHSLFHEEDEDEDDDLVNAPGSMIDVVRDATEGEGAEFRLEGDIDHVADVFIRRIHKQLKRAAEARVLEEVLRDDGEERLIDLAPQIH